MLYNTIVVAPTLTKEGGVILLDILASFLISVMASIAAYYICKWLDGKNNDN
ncbi:MAG: hypothetical protein J5521_08345 [Lachnospiraceae bacterium]|nr:hypothetical protein [Lachnospiraceae bacterium]